MDLQSSRVGCHYADVQFRRTPAVVTTWYKAAVTVELHHTYAARCLLDHGRSM
jgi:hypothetical protein